MSLVPVIVSEVVVLDSMVLVTVKFKNKDRVVVGMDTGFLSSSSSSS